MRDGHVSLKRQPKCMDVDSNLRMLIINPSPNHLTTTRLAAQGQYFKQQTILNSAKGRFPNFATKLNILKSKLRLINLARA